MRVRHCEENNRHCEENNRHCEENNRHCEERSNLAVIARTHSWIASFLAMTI